jgi:hypothetical protein
VVIAKSLDDGRGFARGHGIDVVAIVTPRSPHRARGITADAWMMTPAVAGHERVPDLVAEVKPCLSTRTPDQTIEVAL